MKYLFLILLLSAGTANACQPDVITDDLSIDDITAIIDDIEYQATDKAEVSRHANDFLKKAYKDISHD